MKVTRILHAKRPNKGKLAALREQARRLGQVRAEVLVDSDGDHHGQC
ncbi:hypothetical protein [Thiorhodospira sibirica]|nr:hypothetical protein [Thiorhodospira sibirica]